MGNYDYSFEALEKQYASFIAPSVEITVGSAKIDSAKVPIAKVSVDIGSGKSSGGASIEIEKINDISDPEWLQKLLDKINVGAKLQVSAGYIGKKDVFFGFVDDYTIEYERGKVSAIAINGLDAKGYLMNSENTKYMSQKEPDAIIKEILGQCVNKGFATGMKIGTLKKYETQVIKKNTSDFDFMTSMAELYGMQFIVINGEIIFDDLIKTTKPIIELQLGVSLFGFNKTVSLKGQVGKIIVHGHDPDTGDAISGEADKPSFGGSGKTASDFVSGYSSVVRDVNSSFVKTPDECKRLAQTLFDKQALGFVSGTGRCIGLPELVPGKFIKLSGMDKKTDGSYFITGVKHNFSSTDGYITEFSVTEARSL